jgi:hypothetical protein
LRFVWFTTFSYSFAYLRNLFINLNLGKIVTPIYLLTIGLTFCKSGSDSMSESSEMWALYSWNRSELLSLLKETNSVFKNVVLMFFRGSMISEVKFFIEQLKVNRQVIFIGHHSSVDDEFLLCWQESRVFCSINDTIHLTFNSKFWRLFSHRVFNKNLF